jgi:hypothetical protein
MTANAVRVNMSAEGKSQSRAAESIKFPALFSQSFASPTHESSTPKKSRSTAR